MNKIFRNTITVLIKSERKRFYFLTIADILISIFDIVSLAILLYLISYYSNRTSHIPSWLNFSWLRAQPLLPIVVYFLFFSVKNLAGYLVYRSEFYFAHHVASRISRYSLLKYLEGHFTNYVNTDSAALIRKISLNPMEFCQHVLTGIQQIVREMSLIILTVTAIFIFSAKLFLLLLIILLPPLLLTNWIIKKKLSATRNYVRNSRTKMFRHVQEAISGYVETNIYGKNLVFTDRYSHSQDDLNRHQASLLAIQGLPARLAEIFAVFGLLTLITINFFSGSQSNSSNLVTFGAFVASAYKIIPGVARILNLSSQMRTYAFTLSEIVADHSLTKTVKNPVHQLKAVNCTDLNFAVNNKTIFSKISFEILPSDFVGIAGDSGRGKTTLLNVLLGFLTPSSGEIYFNREKTNPDQRKTFWEDISYVKQDPFLIQDSILLNITLDEHNYDREKLEEVVKMTGLSQLIKANEAGLDFMLTENGKNISGGQRQRIAIARALYKNANLIILDEPFSELDEESEKNLLKLLQELSAQKKMIILVTHNINSLRYCNKVLTIGEPANIQINVN